MISRTPVLFVVLSSLCLSSAEAWVLQQSAATSARHTISTALSSSSSSPQQSTSEAPQPPSQAQNHEESKATTTATATAFSMEVSYEGRRVETEIRRGESILTALERTGVADSLCMPSLPSDCRRGNCLTCVGMHATDSNASHLVRGTDGLSPHVSGQARRRGYILTCSSYVTGDGVKVQLGQNHRAWDDLYRARLEEESTQAVGREATAKVIRISAERNPQAWVKETEEMLRKSE